MIEHDFQEKGTIFREKHNFSLTASIHSYEQIANKS